ncbi:pilus assembly protein HicB [Rhizobium sp. YIM 134829]|jgi:hypothetical protein|uniref:pilus assembly protein HicB n=1 Tax=Rhizobium sp. YIM 134829 TaxID=3390453 RepID=UPI00397DB83B
MSIRPYPLQLPISLQAAAERLAEEDGVSLDSWIASAVAQKIGAVETAEEFLRRKAKGATAAGLDYFLRSAPDVPPQEGDELPDGWPDKA